MKKIILPVARIFGVYLLMYLLQFVLFPNIFYRYFPESNEAFAFLFVTTITLTTVSVIFISDKMPNYLIGILIYFGLIMLYSPDGAYGIGMRGMNLDGMYASYNQKDKFGDTIVFVLVMFITQIIIWGIIKIINIIIQKTK